MYSSYHRVFVLLGLSAFASAFQIDLPQPTHTVNDYSINGFTPKPTGDPLAELRKRDDSSTVCAYLSGDPSEPLTCGGSSVCGYNTVVSWFGCCNGEANGTPTGCPVVTGCVDYTSINACLSNSVCASDTLLVACTDTAAPYCAAGALTVGTETLANYFCDTTAYVLDFELTASGGAASSAFISAFGSSSTVDFAATTSTDDSARSTTLDDFPSSISLALPLSSKVRSTTLKADTASGAAITAVPTSSRSTGLVIPLGGGGQTASSTTSTGGAAIRTGAAVMGAAGGVAGLIMMFA